MAKKKKGLLERLYDYNEKGKSKGAEKKPAKESPAERAGKSVPIFGRIGEALSGKKKKTTKKR